MRPCYRSHYVYCPYVCPVQARNWKQKTWKKSLQGTSKWNANFQMKKSKVIRHQKLKKLLHIWRTCSLTSDESSAGSSGANCKPLLDYFTVNAS